MHLYASPLFLFYAKKILKVSKKSGIIIKVRRCAVHTHRKNGLL